MEERLKKIGPTTISRTDGEWSALSLSDSKKAHTRDRAYPRASVEGAQLPRQGRRSRPRLHQDR